MHFYVNSLFTKVNNFSVFFCVNVIYVSIMWAIALLHKFFIIHVFTFQLCEKYCFGFPLLISKCVNCYICTLGSSDSILYPMQNILKGQLHIARCATDIAHGSIYGIGQGCTRDEGGSCKRFMELPRICYGPPRTCLRMKRLHKGLVL